MTKFKVQMTKPAERPVVAEFISAWGRQGGTAPAPTDAAPVIARHDSAEAISRPTRLPRTLRVLAMTMTR